MPNWKKSDLIENGGYDCMTDAIQIGPVTLDGGDYGQEPCTPLTLEQQQRMEADARLIAAAPRMQKMLEELMDEDESPIVGDGWEHPSIPMIKRLLTWIKEP